MINFSNSRVLITSAVLLLTGATSFTGMSLSLDELTAGDIAQDASVSTDAVTGVRGVIMAGFEPFETIEGLAGTATLRSTGPAISIEGRPLSGGALLDIALIYTSESNDPYDVRGYEDGIFLSGAPMSKVRYDNRILECSEKVTEVVYQTPYTSRASHGYLAGVFLALPRYRGNRFSNRRSSGYHNGSFGYSSRARQGYVRPSSYRRAVRTHDNRQDTRDRVRDTNREDRSNRDTRSRETGRTSGLAGLRSDTPRAENRSGNRRRVDEALISRSETGRQVKVPQSSRTTTRANVTPRSQVRTERSVSTVKTPAPKNSTSRTRNIRKDRTTKTRPKTNSSLSNSVDKAFRSKNPKTSAVKTFKNFFPMQAGYSAYARDVYVSPRCAREETLTLHIPAARLDAARFDGLTVLIIDRNGDEVPVYIPPNYIEGYKVASRNLGVDLQNPSVSRRYP